MAEATPNYDSIDPLDGRYFDGQISTILSERAAVAYQARVEAALAHTLSDFKLCSSKIASEIERASKQVTVEAVYREEQQTKHNIKALVNVIRAKTSASAQPFVHFTATSYDIINTAQALQYREAMQQLILPRLKHLLQTLIGLSQKYADTVQIGRTHGQHALPITFGFALSEYVSRLGQSTLAVQALSEELVGKFSGAVGAANSLSMLVKDPLLFERKLLARLDLQPAQHSTQIVPPEGLIRLLDELGIAAAIMANLANDLRYLQRTEIAEVRERFEPGQTGSSTMAHKRNPWNFEHVASLYKEVLGQLLSAQLNLGSEHQRDLTDSASSRFYPILVACAAAMAERLNVTLAKLEVDPASLSRNLQLTGGAIAAEPLYLLLAKHGHTAAHEKAKALALKAQDSKLPLLSVIEQDQEIMSKYWIKLTEAERAILAEPARYYTGIAAQKARAIGQYWRQAIKRV